MTIVAPTAAKTPNDVNKPTPALEPLAARARTLARRLGAMLYDGLLLLAMMMIVTFLMVIQRGGAVPAGYPPYQFALAAIVAGFYLLFWTRRRQTVGMRAWQLVVERDDHSPLTLADAARRLVASLLSLGAFGLGYLWILVDAEGLAWHDRLTNTRVRFRPRAEAAR
jgi:uncharacterized RDD family membrane protein YckC